MTIPDEDNKYTVDPDDILMISDEAFAALDNKFKAAQEKANRQKARKKATFTQKIVDRAKPESSEYTIYHHAMRGLGLRVRPSGSKSYIFTSKQKGKKNSTRITIGSAEEMTLKEAEDAAYKLRMNLREYDNPHGKTNNAKSYTLDQIFTKYIDDHGKNLSPRWKKQSEQLYRDRIKKEFGHAMINKISRSELISHIQTIDSKNVQRLTTNVLSSMYSWAVESEYVNDHILKGTRTPKQKNRDRVLKNEEIASVFNATFQLPAPFGEYGRFLMLSGQRRTEVARMQWSEIDLENKVWELPANRSKNKTSHIIPLSDYMIEILHSLPRGSDFVFNSSVKMSSPINSFSKMNNHWRAHCWVRNWRLHDLRRTLASGMARLKTPPHVIEAVLNHQRGIVSGVAAIYNRYKYDDEKREALLTWEQHLLSIAAQYKNYPSPYDDEAEI